MCAINALISPLLYGYKVFRRFAVYGCISLCATLLSANASEAPAGEEQTFILVENRTTGVAKIAVPGAKPARVQPGEKAYRLLLEPIDPNGVDAKVWWVSDARQLCVIFVRYEGKVVIAGNKKIKCLGN